MVIHLSACISAYISAFGNLQKIVYSHTFFPMEIHESACKLTCGNSLSPLEFPHVEIHQKLSISARWEIHNFWCISTWGNAGSHVNFHMGKGVFPPARILHILLCISTCGNSLKSVQIHVHGNTLFLMWEFTLKCISPHAVIHQNLCKSAQGIYTFSSAFPQVEIHNYKCRST